MFLWDSRIIVKFSHLWKVAHPRVMNQSIVIVAARSDTTYRAVAYLTTKIWRNVCLQSRATSGVLCIVIATSIAVLGVDRDHWYGKYLTKWYPVSESGAWCCSARSEMKISDRGVPSPSLLGKGSTFCRACTCGDNDHAGDIVRTCRDYVIGRSGNVSWYGYTASDFPWISIETPARVIGSVYSLLASSHRPRAWVLIGVCLL